MIIKDLPLGACCFYWVLLLLLQHRAGLMILQLADPLLINWKADEVFHTIVRKAMASGPKPDILTSRQYGIGANQKKM